MGNFFNKQEYEDTYKHFSQKSLLLYSNLIVLGRRGISFSNRMNHSLNRYLCRGYDCTPPSSGLRLCGKSPQHVLNATEDHPQPPNLNLYQILKGLNDS